MEFAGELTPAILQRRYKRFLADVTMQDGSTITVHCPNTGAMTGCDVPGCKIWLSSSDNPSRKYRYTWELVETAAGTCCIHSAFANKVVGEALEREAIEELARHQSIRKEVKRSDGSRIDFELESDRQTCLVEVKCVTLCRENGEGAFPDAVSSRARRHLLTLEEAVAAGQRAVLLFCVFHTGIETVSPAADIDPEYADTLAQVASRGVEIIAYGCKVESTGIELIGRLPFVIPGQQR